MKQELIVDLQYQFNLVAHNKKKRVGAKILTLKKIHLVNDKIPSNYFYDTILYYKIQRSQQWLRQYA